MPLKAAVNASRIAKLCQTIFVVLKDAGARALTLPVKSFDQHCKKTRREGKRRTRKGKGISNVSRLVKIKRSRSKGRKTSIDIRRGNFHKLALRKRARAPQQFAALDRSIKEIEASLLRQRCDTRESDRAFCVSEVSSPPAVC